jgi:hypothetical protein
MLQVMCPKCGKKQLTNPKTKILRWSGKPDLTGKRKVCVYCGKWFTIRTCLVKEVK